MEWLISQYGEEGKSLRWLFEKRLPVLGLKLQSVSGDYYDLLIAALEDRARKQGLEKMQIYTDKELIELL